MSLIRKFWKERWREADSRPYQRSQPVKPAVGFLNVGRAETSAFLQTAFRAGLKESGFIDGESITVEYHWAEGHFERLASLAADLVHRQITVIAASFTGAKRSMLYVTHFKIAIMLS